MDKRQPEKEKICIEDPKFRITPTQQIAAACTGALLTSLIVTPLDVVKIRLQAQQKMLTTNKCFLFCNGLMDHICPCVPSKNATNYWYRRPSHFNGTLDAFMKIAKYEGVMSLWSGLSPTLILAVPATVVYFVSYEQLRTRLKDRFCKPKPGLVAFQQQPQPFWIPLISGCTARLWAVTTVSPLELIRTKMQSKQLSYMEVSEALQSLMKLHGWTGLWKGLGPTLLRDVPFSGIYWVGYEKLKLRNTPQKKKSTLSVLRSIYVQSGVKGLFTGLIPRIVKVAPACAIMVSTFEYGKSFFEKYNYNEYQNLVTKRQE